MIDLNTFRWNFIQRKSTVNKSLGAVAVHPTKHASDVPVSPPSTEFEQKNSRHRSRQQLIGQHSVVLVLASQAVPLESLN
jgi:hypothetical protein